MAADVEADSSRPSNTHKKAGPKRSWAKSTTICAICQSTMPHTQSALSMKKTFSGQASASGVSAFRPSFLLISPLTEGKGESAYAGADDEPVS